MNRKPLKPGFTLVEILVAVTMIVGILSMVYGSYFATARSTQACQVKIAIDQQARKVLEQMARQIRCAYAPTREKYTHSATPSSQQKRQIPDYKISYFRGNPDEPSGKILHLVTTNAISLRQDPIGELFDVTYQLDMAGGRLLRSEQKFVGAFESLAQERNWQPVIRNIRCVDLTFFNGRQWLRHWDFSNNRKLPYAVRINLTCEDENCRQYQYGTVAYIRPAESTQNSTRFR